MASQKILLVLFVLGGLGDPTARGLTGAPDKSIAANRNAICSDLVMIAARAHQYYSRPAGANGGANSFVGLAADYAGTAKIVPMVDCKNVNGCYSIQTAGTAHQVVIEGVGLGFQVAGGNCVTMRIIVRDQGLPDSLYQVY